VKGIVALVLIAAAVCVRLGIWQLDRRDERRARNRVVAERLAAPPVAPESLPADSATVRYRLVRLDGAPDFSRQIVLSPRTRDGAPGVNIVTPWRRPGNDTAILVNRGWVYAPDALSVELARYDESATAVTGHAEPIAGGADPTIEGHPRTLRRLEAASVAALFPYPVAPFVVIAGGDSARTASGFPLMRVGVPVMDEGPHLSYAFQWFSFAAVALVGGAIVLRLRRRGAAVSATAQTMHEAGWRSEI
jgi:surfeit locus 1 family protein